MDTLVCNKVTKRFGGLTAVSNVDLNVKTASIHSIIGPNGAGKTTLFNCITGFYTPEEGEILFDEHNITGYTPDRVTKRRRFSNLSKYPFVQEHDFRREYHGRHAPPSEVWPVGRDF